MSQNIPDSAPSAPNSRHSVRDDLQNRVENFAKYCGRSSIDLEVLADRPTTILVSPRASESSCDELSHYLEFMVKQLLPSHSGAQSVLYRGAELPKLGQILRCGCDVTPTTAPLFAADSAQKALEYGDMVMVFDPAKLEKTITKVLKSASPEILSRLRAEYPIEEVIEDDWLRFSKLPASNRPIRSANYRHCDFFIPGNPHEALLMIFLIGNNRNALRAEFLQCLGERNRYE